MTDDIMLLVKEIIRKEYGISKNVINIERWGGGAHNTAFRVEIGNPGQLIFVKIEKEDIFPRTRRFQMEREVYGNMLISASGVPCPKLIGYCFDKHPVRYIMQEFIDGKLIGEIMDEYSDEEKQRVTDKIRDIADVLLDIHSDTFGEIFMGGEIGRHKTWNGMMAQISRMLLEDSVELDAFDKDEMSLISAAHESALRCISYQGSPALVHLDLHEFNIFVCNDMKTNIRKLFDFGFVLFMAPYASYYGPCAFSGREEELTVRFNISHEELAAFDIIFSFEMIVFCTGIRFAPDKTYGYLARNKEYISKCRKYSERIIGLHMTEGKMI